MVLGGVGWDRKKFLKSDLHVCGGDDTKIVVYNMGKNQGMEGQDYEILYNLIVQTSQYNINSLSYSEDRFSHPTCV